jgi:hypothetical protein
MNQTELWIDNDRQYYRRKHFMFLRLQELKHQGKYDREKSLKMFKLLTDDVGRKNKISITDRREADKSLRREFEDGYWKQTAKSEFPDRYKRVFKGWHTVDHTFAKDKNDRIRRANDVKRKMKAKDIRLLKDNIGYKIQANYGSGTHSKPQRRISRR